MANLAEQYAAGLSLDDLQELTGINRVTIHRRLKDVDPEYYRNFRIFSPHNRRCFVMYCKTRSLRKVAWVAGGSRKTYAKKFKQMHPDYADIARRGVFASSVECANRVRKKHPEKAREIEQWLFNNLQRLLTSEAEAAHSTMSLQREGQLSRKELGRKEDYRSWL